MRSDWLLVARNFRRALALTLKRGDYPVQLCGQTFRLCYESRKAKQDRDYPLMQRLAQGRRCIFDVGANHGLASLVMSTTLAQDGRIVAFEASEEACRVARYNLMLNGLSSRVQVVNALVAERTGQAIDFYWENASGGASIIPGYLGHATSINKIALSLDTFCEVHDLAPELIKIDIEGAEARALAGMVRLLANFRPDILVELHSWQEMSVTMNAAHILELLSSVDYQMIYLRTRSQVQDPQILASRGRCHVLIQPLGKAVPTWLGDFDTSNL